MMRLPTFSRFKLGLAPYVYTPLVFTVFFAGLVFLVENVKASIESDLERVCHAKNYFTAPSYVSITIVDGLTGETFDSTVESTTLIDSLATELGVLSQMGKEDARKQVFDQIDQHPDMRFVLSNSKAVDALRPQYEESHLVVARELLAAVNLEEVRSDQKALAKLELRYYEAIRKKVGSWVGGQAALARVLLEKGFFPGRGDIAPGLYLIPSPCRSLDRPRK